jgi:ferritin-like metal-binding protein YciE
MPNSEERLMQWLRDAHAMEKQAEKMLSALAGRIESYPQLKKKIKSHLEETKEQAERLESCIERRGGDTSLLKDAGAQVVAMAQGFSGIFAGDEVIKGSLASYTFEHMEIASYRILITAAEEAGDTQTVRVCRKILNEEEAMANWLLENIEPLTREYMKRDEKDLVGAKR